MANQDERPTHTPGVRKGEDMKKTKARSQGAKTPGRLGLDVRRASRPAGTRARSRPTDPIDPKSPDMPPD